MQLKILQLNIYGGTYFNELKSFLQTNYFDILCFQEVSGIDTKVGSLESKIDCFNELKTILENTHSGKLAISQFTSSNPKTGYFGNAIFYPKDALVLDEYILPLFERTTPFQSDSQTLEEIGRNVLHLTLKKDDTAFDVLTTHLALAKDPQNKTEEAHQQKQNSKLLNYVLKLKNKFILTGDFNLQPDQPTVLELEKYARDLTKEFNIKNTIDPLHKAWERIKPGFPIDYIFVSKDINVIDFKVLDNVHISDHFCLSAKVEI